MHDNIVFSLSYLLQVDLDASLCMKQECNIGNLLADTMAYEFMIKFGPGTRKTNGFLVLIPGKRITTTIEVDEEITDEVLKDILPYSDQIVVKTVNGSVVRKVLEKSLEG